MKGRNSFLLTFDLEEFDIPLEFNKKIVDSEMYSVSYKGCKRILKILENYDINATFFTTAKFGQKHPDLIQYIGKMGHEIALHGYVHNDNYSTMNADVARDRILENKHILEELSPEKVIGFRAPRLEHPSFELLKKIGLEYDSSIHPTYIPRRYNNFRSPRHIYREKGLVEVPISVMPFFRLPFSWIWFRNLGLKYGKFCTYLTTYDQDFINVYFHPWEFVDIKLYDLSLTLWRNTGDPMLKMMDEYLAWCLSKEIEFKTIKDYLMKDSVI